MKATIAFVFVLLVSIVSVNAQYNQKTRRSKSQREQADSASESASQGQYGNPPPEQRNRQAETYRQQDTTKSATPASPTKTFEEKNKPQNPDQYVIDRTTQSDRTDYNLVSTEGMTLVAPRDYPASLRKTLGNKRYNGWDSGKLYRDESTGEYLLIMGKNGDDSKPLNYRFDKDGNSIDDKNHR